MSRACWFALGAAVAGAGYAAVVALAVRADRRHLAQLMPGCPTHEPRKPLPATYDSHLLPVPTYPGGSSA